MTSEQLPEAETKNDSDNCDEENHFGQKLKVQREHLNMTQSEAASKLNLDVSYIQAIEMEDFSEMSSTSYIYGYIRSYAKVLKLPEQEILDMYKQGVSEEHQLLPDYMGQKTPYSSIPTSKNSWSILFVIVVSLVATTWWFLRQS